MTIYFRTPNYLVNYTVKGTVMKILVTLSNYYPEEFGIAYELQVINPYGSSVYRVDIAALNEHESNVARSIAVGMIIAGILITTAFTICVCHR